MTARRERVDERGLAAFSADVLVVCPACAGRARVRRTWNMTHRHWTPATLACTACGTSRLAETRLCCARCPIPLGAAWRGAAIVTARRRCGTCGVWAEHERRVSAPPQRFTIDVACPRCAAVAPTPYELRPVPRGGAAVDPCFGLPLWLTAPCAGETLWAYNLEHVDALATYLGASLRGNPRNTAAFTARLPRWMTAAHRRDEVIRTLARLRRRAAAM